jgi:signal peptidase I
MIVRFLRTHRAIHAERDRVYDAAAGEDRGLSSPWLILGVGIVMLGALDVWLFGGAPLFDDRTTPYVPWNVLAPQIVVSLVSVAVITVVMAILGAPTSLLVVARLWAYVMGHVATVLPPALLAILGVRSLLFDSVAIETPAAVLFSFVAVAVLAWLGAGLRRISGNRTLPAVAAVVLALGSGIAVMDAKRQYVSRFYDIESGSMRPIFDRGDRILTSSMTLIVRAPRRGDIVVYTVPEGRGDRTYSYVHRIVGVPGDRVAFADCGVIVNGRAARTGEPVESEHRGIRTPRWVMPESLGGKAYQITFEDSRHQLCQRRETAVPPGFFFVAGDARDRSLDSRMPAPGLVPRAAITGIAIFVYASRSPSRRL